MKKIFFIICSLLLPLFFVSAIYIHGIHASSTPQVIMVPGWGSGLTADSYNFVINDITNQGFQVIKYYPTYQNISNYPALLANWTQGVKALANGNSVVVIGHSVGGDVAMNFCANNSNCVGAINLDGGATNGYKISSPLLYLQGGIGAYCTGGCIPGRTQSQQVVGQSNQISEMIYMPALRHMNFTDYAASQSAYPNLVSQGYFGSIPYQTADTMITNQINLFLSTYPH